MYPISLKQITAEKANVDYANNVPGTVVVRQITILK
jgi:hypothetical protein